MKIEHTVRASQEEVNDIFDAIITACLSTYPTVEDQALSLAQAKTLTESKLTNYFSKAFKLGKKLGKRSADTKDDEMYAEGSSGT